MRAWYRRRRHLISRPLSRLPESSHPIPPRSPRRSGATNTNVSVRVLSPGDNGAVDQDNSATVPSSEPADDAASSSGSAQGTGGQPSDSSQYHDRNSQYQSADITDNTQEESSDTTSLIEPWNWTWELSVCDGDATSISTESGSKESRDWTWNWIWNWSCDDPGSGTSASNDAPSSQDRRSGSPQPGPANVNVSIRVLSPGDNGSVSQTNTSPTVSDAASTPSSSGGSDADWSGRPVVALDVDLHVVRYHDGVPHGSRAGNRARLGLELALDVGLRRRSPAAIAPDAG